MNLTNLFEIQRKLDAEIEEKHPTAAGEDRLAKRILALQVELGECANEWRGFKFWSTDKKPRIEDEYLEYRPVDQGGNRWIKKNPLLEEYVDCLHFILSIGIEMDFVRTEYDYLHEHNVPIYKSYSSVTDQFNSIFSAIIEFCNVSSLEIYEELFLYFISLGEMLGFTWEQIEEAYMSKNKTNWERQTNGY